MAMMERGSFVWCLMAATQTWLSIKLLDDVSGAITTLFGSSTAALFIIGLVVFKQEQRELLLNPLKTVQKEVHNDQQKKQGKAVWMVVGLWFVTMITGSIAL